MFCASHINQGHGVHTVPFRAIPTQALAIHKDMTQVPSATATQDLTATRDPEAWASTGSMFFEHLGEWQAKYRPQIEGMGWETSHDWF